MAGRNISIDEKIERQKDVVSAAKEKYDAALAELDRLMQKKKDLQGKRMMNTMYDELGPIMGEIEADVMILEAMILNGKSQKANYYLQEAIAELRHALSDMSDAEFEITTTPCEDL